MAFKSRTQADKDRYRRQLLALKKEGKISRREFNRLLRQSGASFEQQGILKRRSDLTEQKLQSYQDTEIVEVTRSGKTYSGGETTIQGEQVFVGARPVSKKEQQVKATRQANVNRGFYSIRNFSSVPPGTPKDLPITAKPVVQRKTSNIETVSPGQQQRIEKLLKREERLKGFVNLGGILEPSKSRSVWSVGEVAKTVARKPLEIGSAPVFLGGRLAFAGESLFSKAGRTELKEATGRVVPALKQAYDPRKPSGLLNIGLTALSVYNLGQARAIQREQIKVSTEGSSTVRTTTDSRIVDRSTGIVKAKLGNRKEIVGKVDSSEYFYKVTDIKYLGTGSGKIKYSTGTGSRTVTYSSRSISGIKKTGVDTTTIAQITKGQTYGQKYFITNTNTQTLTTNPFQSFRSLSTTKSLGARTPLSSSKPYSVSTGVTTETLRYNYLSETGQNLGTVQLLNTGKISLGAKTVNQNYQISVTKPSISGRAGSPSTVLSQKTGTVTTGSGLNFAVANIQNVAKSVQASDIALFSSSGLSALGGIRFSSSQKGSSVSRPVSVPGSRLLPGLSSDLSVSGLSGQGVSPVSEQKPFFSGFIASRTRIRPGQTSATRPRSNEITGQAIYSQSLTGQSVAKSPVTVSRTSLSNLSGFGFRNEPTAPVPAPVPAIPLKFNINLPGLTRKRKAKSISSRSRYRPSLEAFVFNISGSVPKNITPFSLRPKKRKKKTKR